MLSREFRITGDGSHTIYLPELDETYHSTHGAIQESKYVFIRQGVDFFLESSGMELLKVFELGFGTGLNALLTALYATRACQKVYFESLEAFPLAQEEVLRLNYPDLLDDPESSRLFDDIHRSGWGQKSPISANFSLLKVNELIQEYQPTEKFHVCFFDAFAPSRQPEMWEKHILVKVRDLLTHGGVFVTYCAKGQLKRDLKMLGFEVETVPGAPGKKEMVRAFKI